MTHDPLCPWSDLGDDWADVCGDCNLIARVREDERAKREADGPWFRSVVHECCEKAQSERAAALRDAVEAVQSVTGPLHSVRNSGDAQRGWDAAVRHAVAAIEALEGDR